MVLAYRILYKTLLPLGLSAMAKLERLLGVNRTPSPLALGERYSFFMNDVQRAGCEIMLTRTKRNISERGQHQRAGGIFGGISGIDALQAAFLLLIGRTSARHF